MIKVYTDRDMFGSEYALIDYDKDVAENQREAKENGIDPDEFSKHIWHKKV